MYKTNPIQVLTQRLQTEDSDVTVLHDADDVSAIGADSHVAESAVHGAEVKQQLAAVDVDETHDAILGQHTKDLHKQNTVDKSK
jgi:hypothetical protein